jgi:hypothetical protein
VLKGRIRKYKLADTTTNIKEIADEIIGKLERAEINKW